MDERDYPHVFLIVLDTVRSKNFSYNRSGEETTPFLNKLSNECLRFENCFSPAPMTVPSHASMFTGVLESTHQTNNENPWLPKRLTTLAEVLSSEGYDTVGFSNNSHVSPEFNFDKGFDVFKHNMSDSYGEVYDNGFPIVPLGQKLSDYPLPIKMLQATWFVSQTDYSVINTGRNWFSKRYLNSEANQTDRGAQSTNEFVDNYLKNHSDGPLFMFLNYMEAHDPYRFPDSFHSEFINSDNISRRSWSDLDKFYRNGDSIDNPELRQMESQYNGAIRYLDSILEDLIKIIKSNGYYDNTMIFITSDHGEAFGENKLYGHRGGLYNELIKVPLLVKLPRSEDQSDIHSPVSNRWVFSTILNRIGASVPNDAIGYNILDSANYSPISESPPVKFPANTEPDYSRFKGKMVSTVDPESKYIYYSAIDKTKAYDLTESESRSVDENIEKRLKQIAKDSLENRHETENRSIDPATEAHLEELGYK